MSRKAILFWAFFLIWLAIDQATKLWVYANVELDREAITIIPGYFDIMHHENPGAAFSLFHTFEYRHLLFLSFTAVAIWVVWDQYKRVAKHDTWMPIALGLIASGAIGNGIDRIWKRTVTDMFSVYIDSPDIKEQLIAWFNTNRYPTFNVADAALLVGVFIFVIAGFYEERAAKAEAVDASQTPVPE